MLLTGGLAFVTLHSGSGSPSPSLASVATPTAVPDGQPAVETLATYGSDNGLVLRVPIRQQRITAILRHLQWEPQHNKRERWWEPKSRSGDTGDTG